MKKILIPTDGSELADYAYGLAHQIAEKTHANIEVISIVPAPPDSVFDTEGNLKNDEGEDFTSFYQQSEVIQKKLVSWLANKSDAELGLVKIGRVDEDIVRYVNNNNIDLVVMGTSGAQGMDEMLRGSHAQHIVRSSPVPVLSLKCDRSDMEIQDILLASDFEKVEQVDLTVLKEIQQAFGARLNLLKINTPTNFDTNRNIKSNMEKFVALNMIDNVQMHIYCEETVEKGLVNFSTDTRIDFLAMQTHQRKGLGRLFNKSISESVVNHLRQPVLTFPV